MLIVVCNSSRPLKYDDSGNVVVDTKRISGIGELHSDTDSQASCDGSDADPERLTAYDSAPEDFDGEFPKYENEVRL